MLLDDCIDAGLFSTNSIENDMMSYARSARLIQRRPRINSMGHTVQYSAAQQLYSVPSGNLSLENVPIQTIRFLEASLLSLPSVSPFGETIGIIHTTCIRWTVQHTSGKGPH